MIKLFCGYDLRETVGFHTFVHSVMTRTKAPVEIIPLAGEGMRQGSNAFTYSRWLVADRCGYKGHALFCDAADQVALADVRELDEHFDPRYAAQVVKHPDYTSLHGRKYIGTPMECVQSNYPRKNHASVMIINCEHKAWRSVFPSFAATANPGRLMEMRFLEDDQIGELPKQWNVLIDEGQDGTDAKLLHWTVGIPGFRYYRDAPRAGDWWREMQSMSEVQQ